MARTRSFAVIQLPRSRYDFAGSYQVGKAELLGYSSKQCPAILRSGTSGGTRRRCVNRTECMLRMPCAQGAVVWTALLVLAVPGSVVSAADLDDWKFEVVHLK